MVMAASFWTLQSKLLSVIVSTPQEVNVKIIFLPVFPAWYPSDNVLSVLGYWGTNWGSTRTWQREGM